jgi:hypothetical protein
MEDPRIIVNEGNRIIRLSRAEPVGQWFSLESIVIGQGDAPITRKEIRFKKAEAAALAKALAISVKEAGEGGD